MKLKKRTEEQISRLAKELKKIAGSESFDDSCLRSMSAGEMMIQLDGCQRFSFEPLRISAVNPWAFDGQGAFHKTNTQ